MSETTARLWVGVWYGSRTVVYDPSLQPEQADLVFLYFVQGKALCARLKEKDRPHLKKFSPEFRAIFAIDQYKHWMSLQNHEELVQRCKLTTKPDSPPIPGRACAKCGGDGSWHYQIGTFSDGANSDGQNYIERCNRCSGTGSVDNVYEL